MGRDGWNFVVFSRWIAKGNVREVHFMLCRVMLLLAPIWASEGAWLKIPSMPGLSPAEDSVFQTGLSSQERCPEGEEEARYSIEGGYRDEESLDSFSLRDARNPTEIIPLQGFSEELKRAKIELGDSGYRFPIGRGRPYVQTAVDEQGRVVLAISIDLLGAVVFRTVDSILSDGKKTIRWRISGVNSRKHDGKGVNSPKRSVPYDVGSGNLSFLDGILFFSDPGFGYWRSADLGETWDSIDVTWESTLVSHGDTVISFGMPRSNVAFVRVSLDRGITWGPRRSIDESIETIRFREGMIWGYGLSDGGIGIVMSADLGATWKTVRNEIRPLVGGRIALTPRGGLYLATSRGTEYLSEPSGSWKICSVASPNWKFDKIRQVGDDLVGLAHAATSGYEWGTMMRFRRGTWQVVEQHVRDFEVSNRRIFAAFEKPEESRNRTGGDAGELVQWECIAALNDVGGWDTVFQDSFVSDCEYGYKGSGPYCGMFYLRMFANSAGTLFASTIARTKDGAAVRTGYLRSVDGGISWEHVDSLRDTLPSIDTTLFRVDSLNNLYIRQSDESVGLHATNVAKTVTLQGRHLRIHLEQEGPVQIDLVSPTGTQEPLARPQRFAAGDHLFELPKAKGVRYARVRVSGKTETIGLPVH